MPQLQQTSPRMSRKFIDLSLTLDDVPSERVPVTIRYTDHRAGAHQMAGIFGVAADAFPDGLGWAGEEVTLITHAGTHMDAPWHYGPLSEGSPARYIDQVPLEWCYGPGVVLDMRHKADGEEIDVREVRMALDNLDHKAGPSDIVLIMTGADRYWTQPDYPERGSGLGWEATRWLVQQGVRIIGTDAWGLDRPFGAMRREYERNKSVQAIWPAHFAGRDREYCQ